MNHRRRSLWIALLGISCLVVAWFYFADRSPPGTERRVAPSREARVPGAQHHHDPTPRRVDGCVIVLRGGEADVATVPAPLSRATVRVSSRGSLHDDRETTSDTSGVAVVPRLEPGEWLIEVSGEGILTSSQVHRVADQDVDAPQSVVVDVRLLSRLVGRVITSRAEPASGAAVIAEGAGSRSSVSRVLANRATADHDGEFELVDIRPDREFELSVRHESGIARRLIEPLVPGEVREVEISLSSAAGIIGTTMADVVQARGVIDAYWVDSRGNIEQRARALVGPDSTSFRFIPLEPGEWLLTHSLRTNDSYFVGFERVVVAPDMVVDVGLLKHGSDRLALLVNFPPGETRDIRQCELGLQVIHAQDSQGLPLMTHSFVAPVGRPIQIVGVPRGRVIVDATARTPEGTPRPGLGAATTELEFSGGYSRVDLTLVTRTSSDTRVDATIGALPHGVVREDARVRWWLRRGDEIVHKVLLAPSGRLEYRRSGVQPGDYVLHALVEGHECVADVHVSRHAAVELGGPWTTATTVDGVVHLASGDPVSHAVVHVVDKNGYSLMSTRTDLNGEFSFGGVPSVPGLRVRAASRDGAAVEPLDARQQAYRVILHLR